MSLADIGEIYARAAIDAARAHIVSAPNGFQEQTLHRECFSIGGLVGARLIAESVALAALVDAARQMPAYGRPWAGLRRKVTASLRRGMQRPRNFTPRPDLTSRHVRLPAPPPLEPTGLTTTEDALAVWNASVDPRRTPVENYLNGRALELDDALAGEVIRWFPPRNAMVCLFRSIETGEPQAVSRTFLSCAPVPKKLDRKFLGPVGGAAVKLDADDAGLGGLHIGEGVETCLSARQLGLRPCWALGSAGAVGSFPVLAGIECLTLLAENDDASARAVEACAARWHAAGREVIVNEPIEAKDLNDALLRRARR